MLFNSLFFICIFFPCVLVGWYGLQRLTSDIPAKLFLLGMSLWFYGYYNISYLWVLLSSILVNYLFLRLLGSVRFHSRWLLFGGIGLNLGLLFYLKYFNFFVDNCNYLLHSSISVEKIALPLGISFFTFQQISILVDQFDGKVKCNSFLDYSCFISYFPQLVAGPIVLEDEFLPQLKERSARTFSSEGFLQGFSRFTLGLSKKVLLADTLALFVDGEYGNLAALDSLCAWITIIFYMLQLYFDFSGYSDMAIGLGKMMGFDLPENFNSPLLAVSVRDFWRKWHITLGRFFTRYLYIPLGGNRKGLLRQCLNLFVVFFLSGIWHGANWTFVVWGTMHALAVVAEALFAGLSKRRREGETGLSAREKTDGNSAADNYILYVKQLLTFIYVTLSFSIFRADTLKDAIVLWKKLFFGGYNGLILGASNLFVLKETFVIRKAIGIFCPDKLNWVFVGTMLLLLFGSIFLIHGMQGKEWIAKKGRTKGGLFWIAVLFVWSFLSLSGVSTFLYFNF